MGSVVLLTCDSACPTALNHKPHTAHKWGLLTSVLRKPSHLLVWMMLHILLSFSFFFFLATPPSTVAVLGEAVRNCSLILYSNFLKLTHTLAFAVTDNTQGMEPGLVLVLYVRLSLSVMPGAGCSPSAAVSQGQGVNGGTGRLL